MHAVNGFGSQWTRESMDSEVNKPAPLARVELAVMTQSFSCDYCMLDLNYMLLRQSMSPRRSGLHSGLLGTLSHRAYLTPLK